MLMVRENTQATVANSGGGAGIPSLYVCFVVAYFVVQSKNVVRILSLSLALSLSLSLSLSLVAPMPGNSSLPIYNPSQVPRAANQLLLSVATLCLI